MKNKLDNINDIISFLSNMSSSDEAPTIICEKQTNVEQVIVGTRNAYLRAAIELLKISVATIENKKQLKVDLDIEEDIVNGSVCIVYSIKKVFDESGDVWPVCAYIASDHDEVEKIIDFYRQ